MYNFRYSSWVRWLWFLIMISLLLFLQYIYPTNNKFLIWITLFLIFLTAFRFYRVLSYRIVVDLENSQIKIGKRIIPLRIRNMSSYTDLLGFNKLTVEFENEIITVSSSLEDFELFGELLQKQWEEEQIEKQRHLDRD